MGKRYSELSDNDIQFIARQKMFFVGTAAAEGRVSVSPKGLDSFRVLSRSRVVWLNVTGSGNETAAHVLQDPRMTVMFCAFEGAPLILRLYGTAKTVHRNDPEWIGLLSLFEPLPGARQIFDLAVDLVQTSCGMGVPFYDYVGERGALSEWALKKGEDGLKKYWEDKNQFGIDGAPTHIMDRNT